MSPVNGPRAVSKRTPWQVQKAVLFALLQRELKTRFGGRWLGIFWTLLEPIAHLTILLLIFVYVRHRILPGVEFTVFLLSGVVPYFLFRSIAMRVMDAVDGNRGLFGYRQVKPLDTMLARAGLEVCVYGSVYTLMLGTLAWLGFEAVPARPLELMGAMALLIVMGFALGLVFAITTDDLPQLRTFVRLLFLPLYLMSGVIFPIGSLPTDTLVWFTWNPVLHVIEQSRGYYFPLYHVVAAVDIRYSLAFTGLTLAGGLALYRVRRNNLLAT